MDQRIRGIDVARALAVIGMILVNFKMIFGQKGESWIGSFSSILDGKAAATFVVLAGVGLAFMTRSAIVSNNQEVWKRSNTKIFKRALLLFFIGLSYIAIWPADILHFYGVYMLVTLAFIKVRPRYILLLALGIIFAYPVLMMLIDYDKGWDFGTFEYDGFWSVDGFFRNLFYNGFHPVVPWSAFMLVGLWFGRQNLSNDRFVKKSLGVGLSIFILIKLISLVLIAVLSEESVEAAKELSQVLGTSPMPPLPIYMLSGSSMAIAIISACILVSNSFGESPVIQALVKTGQLALTFYVAHVVIGVGLVEAFGTKVLGEYSLNFSIGYALIFSASCVWFAIVWFRYQKVGPLEWVLRKLTN